MRGLTRLNHQTDGFEATQLGIFGNMRHDF